MGNKYNTKNRKNLCNIKKPPKLLHTILSCNVVNTTIFTSKIQELPPTSDTKMIDIWLIFCLLVPFAFALVQTAIECNG